MGGGTVDGGVGDRQRMEERINEWGWRGVTVNEWRHE